MNSLQPSALQFEQLLTLDPGMGPVTMINMLRYRESADYGDRVDENPCSGRDAYGRYSEAAFPIVVELQGKPVWMSTVEHVFIGPESEHWDDVVVVQWPTLAAFQKLMQRPDYHAIAFHRDAALADSRLIITQSQFVDFN